MKSPDFNDVPIELYEIENVHPYEFNNKKHPEKHIDLLMRSIKTHGHLDPLVLDRDGVIISGHGRFEALKRLGRKKVAVRVLRDISEAEASALRIAANKTVSTEYDTDALMRELANLGAADFDLEALGFNEKELSMLTIDVGEIDMDMVADDMTAAVEKHESDVADKAEEVSVEGVLITKAFGFKTIPLRDQKHVSRFMAQAEEETGLQGADALIAYMKAHLAKAA